MVRETDKTSAKKGIGFPTVSNQASMMLTNRASTLGNVTIFDGTKWDKTEMDGTMLD